MDSSYSLGRSTALILVTTFLLTSGMPLAWGADWRSYLDSRLQGLEASYDGEVGVYVEQLDSGESYSQYAEEYWYLASTIKIPVAIAVLEAVDAGEVSLDDRVELKPEDFVDGAGETNWKSPGDKVTIDYLFEQMLVQSDNTATDALVRAVGVDEVNALVQREFPDGGVNRITTLADVRREAYRSFHEDALNLNTDGFFAIKKAGMGDARVDALASFLGVDRSEFRVGTLDEAFAQYYEDGLNSGKLSVFSQLFAKLERGEILSAQSREYLIDHLERIETGKNRLQAGLPDRVRFYHKTGTQYRTACNMGVAHPEGEGSPVLIAVCTRGSLDLAASERAMRSVGEWVGSSGVLGD